MKILITGSLGQLGKEIIKLAPKKLLKKDFELIGTNKENLNLCDLENCENFINDLNPDWIINCAAYTNVDKAEKEEDIAYLVNASAPKILAETIEKKKTKMLHISTDYVFDGMKSIPYKTEDLRNPLGIYGKSKKAGEDAVIEALGPSSTGYIIRTSWLYSKEGKNFKNTILKLLQEREIIDVVSDQIGTPTSTYSLANACWKLISNIEDGIKTPLISHWTDAGVASWYDFAVAIYEINKSIDSIKKGCKIIPIPSSSYKSIAPRPYFSVLDCTNTRRSLSIQPLHWRTSLERDMSNKYND